MHSVSKIVDNPCSAWFFSSDSDVGSIPAGKAAARRGTNSFRRQQKLTVSSALFPQRCTATASVSDMLNSEPRSKSGRTQESSAELSSTSTSSLFKPVRRNNSVSGAAKLFAQSSESAPVTWLQTMPALSTFGSLPSTPQQEGFCPRWPLMCCLQCHLSCRLLSCSVSLCRWMRTWNHKFQSRPAEMSSDRDPAQEVPLKHCFAKLIPVALHLAIECRVRPIIISGHRTNAASQQLQLIWSAPIGRAATMRVQPALTCSEQVVVRRTHWREHHPDK